MRIHNNMGFRRGLIAAAVVGLAALGCDAPTDLRSELEPAAPELHIDDEQPIRMTGGGRIDSPPGSSEKNTPESRVFQTFGFNIAADRDGDGAPDGNLQFVDHTPEHRLEGRPVNLHSVSWSTFTRTVDGCEDAGVEATGTLEVRNTGEHHAFRMWACDNGEPGVGRDIFTLDVFYGDGVGTRWRWSGMLTGGNLQAHFDPNGGGTEPTTGALDATTETGGSDLDPDGYTVSVDGTQSQAIGVNATVRFEDLAAGDHSVELTGVASNCTVSGSNPRTVSVTAGAVASTTFSVTCEATSGTEPTTGDLTVATATTGSDIPTGYTLNVSGPGGSATEPIGANASRTFSAIASGDYSVELTDVAANCTVSGSNPRTVTVPGGGAGSTTFDVTCEATGGTEPTTGDLTVATATTGEDIPTGYTLNVSGPGGSASEPIGANASRTFSAIASGDYSVELTDVAANCTISGSNPRTVTVPGGGAGSTTFDVTCTATGGGGEATVRITGLGSMGSGTATPGENQQDFDFEATDAPDGTLSYTDWGVVRADGTVGRLTVDSATDPETAVTSFTRSTVDPACATFGGTARVDTGELAVFTVTACDRASPGVDQDSFRIELPERGYVRDDLLKSGDIVLSTL